MSLIRYQGHLDFFRPMQPGEALEWLMSLPTSRDRSRRSAMRTAYRAKTRRRNRRRK